METTVAKKTWTEKELMSLPVILVYHSPRPDKLLAGSDILNGEDIFTGFTLPVSELFVEL